VIVPRWEWRTFGEEFGEAEERFAALRPEGVEESDELYLLSPGGGASVKVRGGLMDLKRLERVGDDGLEQWRPVLKAPFPLPAEDAGTVLQALGVEPRLERAGYTLDQLLEEAPDLRTVEVHKRRQRYTVDGCMAELSEFGVEGATTRTIAVESEDAELVTATVRELGLASRRNVNVPRGLKALVGFGSHRYAAIDVGTNSVKLYVGELRADGEWGTVAERSEVTRLGEGVAETGRLGKEPLERTEAAIAALADEARSDGAEAIVAVGTAGLRAAANSGEFLEDVRERAGVELEVISGDEEARLAYLAVQSGLGPGEGSLVVFDSGGGSSQFTFGDGERVDEQFSVPVGAVRFTERFGLDQAVGEEAVAAAREAVAAELAPLDGRPAPDRLVGIGGAVTNLAAVKHALATYDPDVVRGTVLDAAEVDRQIALYRARSAEERRGIPGLQPKRAEVILAGACIVRTVLEKLGSESLTVSDRGLRHGLLAERFKAP
jgi:exopolyphosphatase/guanosine-5'-triphosphate,3'-diphosphate pyrophosphatase